MAGRRIVITGVANGFGLRLARRLAERAEVERVVGVDTRDPGSELSSARVELVRADLRGAELAGALRRAAPDAIVHNDIVQVPETGRSARQLHDVNVIGTLRLLVVCDGLPTLRRLVVRGSAAIYGSEAGAPAFFTEAMSERFPHRTRFQRDVAELEGLVDGFARRRPAVACCVLRMQPVVGRAIDTPVGRLLRLPVVPTMLGFDPRVQLLDADDAVAALEHAVLGQVRGPVNVAATQTVSMSRALRRLGRPALPVAPPLYPRVAETLRRLARQPQLPDEVPRYLRHGRGVDTTRMREELGFAPRHTTLDAIARLRGAASAPRAA